MKLPPAQARDLLRRADSGALGTHGVAMPGYPFVSMLPYVLDEECHPVVLVSRLAEHTQNLLRDSRSSMMVAQDGPGSVLSRSRMTVVGDLRPWEPPAEFVDRYLRYQPEAERYLALGDFLFFRMALQRVRYIAGFANICWIEAEELIPAFPVARDVEAELAAAAAAAWPENRQFLGVDAEGIDYRVAGHRRRQEFDAPCTSEEELRAAVEAFAGTAH